MVIIYYFSYITVCLVAVWAALNRNVTSENIILKAIFLLLALSSIATLHYTVEKGGVANISFLLYDLSIALLFIHYIIDRAEGLKNVKERIEQLNLYIIAKIHKLLGNKK